MRSGNITGHVDVSISGGKEGGIIFFNNGESIGTSCSWKDELGIRQLLPENLSQRTKKYSRELRQFNFEV